MAQMLQRTAGNRAAAALLTPRAHSRRGAATLQRKLWPYKGKDNHALQAIGAKVQSAVDTAVLTVAADPTLAAHPAKTSGYLAQWIATYAAYLENPAAVPLFYFARYGYAVETIATLLLKNESILPHRFNFQIAAGHTRPDIVVTDPRLGDGAAAQVAWIDITSEASKGHIYRKQGGGWVTRAYVAEACYDMPLPSALAKGGPALDKETLKRIEGAAVLAAEEEAYFEVGRQAIGAEIAAALAAKYTDKGGGLSRADARLVVTATCKGALSDGVTAPVAKSVLYTLDAIDVGTASDAGASWANWAYGQAGIATQKAREELIAYGKRLHPPTPQADVNMDETQ
ncbi:MAG TPA: hypothetical protein VG186_04525 [Solirubrobacteraceae bacterium]|nr:hypothetical protein [Solirubrobacteraceae bacterium]